MRIAVIVAIAAMQVFTACVPIPKQLGLVAPPPLLIGPTVGARVEASSTPLYRLLDNSGATITNVFGYGPQRFEVAQGPQGSLVWVRSSAFDCEIEAIVRQALTVEELKEIRNLFPPASVPGLVLVPCPLDVLAISPLAKMPIPIRVSFSSGRDASNLDILIIRINTGTAYRAELLEMINSQVGVLMEMHYRIGNNDTWRATISLHSGTL